MSEPWRYSLRIVVIALGVAVARILAAHADTATEPVPSSDHLAEESYALPISPPMDQGDSDLCWAFAALSMLETNYRVRHPGSQIEFSRAALQRQSIADRFRRYISGNSSHLEDGGIAIDALALARAQGLVALPDFHGVVDSDTIFASVKRKLARIAAPKPKWTMAEAELTARLGSLPRATHIDGKTVAPEKLAAEVLGAETWEEFDVAHDGHEGLAASDDPDARPEARVRYEKLDAIIARIHQSLAHGEAVVWSNNDNHTLLIYGGDYDASGRPVSYLVKDTFAPYTYRAPAEAIHKVLTDITVAVPAPVDDAISSAANRRADAPPLTRTPSPPRDGAPSTVADRSRPAPRRRRAIPRQPLPGPRDARRTAPERRADHARRKSAARRA